MSKEECWACGCFRCVCDKSVPKSKREWVGLTDEDIKNAVLDDPIGASALMSLMRDEVMVTQVRQAINRIAQTIEAKLKEKNA